MDYKRLFTTIHIRKYAAKDPNLHPVRHCCCRLYLVDHMLHYSAWMSNFSFRCLVIDHLELLLLGVCWYIHKSFTNGFLIGTSFLNVNESGSSPFIWTISKAVTPPRFSQIFVGSLR